ncbi:YheC/YheD family protein [Bacillaceae bacterium Marseille-Q3522]|nr:YheC/YheD family protein [Bacillaceae bacterium Marseille-Q3522]
MNILYDQEQKEWGIETETEHDFTFGHNKISLCQIKNQANTLVKFSVNNNKKHVGPLIGIMTALRENGILAGNISLFKALQKEVVKRDGIIVIFHYRFLSPNGISGYIYDNAGSRWILANCPLPDIIYNRIPYRDAEKTVIFQEVISFLRKENIPFFNPGFLNKYEQYRILAQHPEVKKSLPDFIVIKNAEALENFLAKKQKLYIKPADGAKGKGILRLWQAGGQGILLIDKHSSSVFPDFADFWQQYHSMFQNQVYLAQMEIEPDIQNGNRYDFRILVHYDDDRYQISGIGVRQAEKNSLFTHIPNGGSLLPYEAVRTKSHDQFFQTIISHCGKILTDNLGFFGEFSLDAAVATNGSYVIYEVNAKPMLFDEAEIEQNRVKNLSRLFFQMSGF